MLTLQETEDLKEILRLHDEAFSDYLTRHNYGHKSSEGSVSIHFSDYWDREGYDAPGARGEISVGIYSYALSPIGRQHYFESTAEALREVREWHRVQMERPSDE